jgi:hypothetical protein
MTGRIVGVGIALTATATAFALTSCGVRATSQTSAVSGGAANSSPLSVTNSSGWTVSVKPPAAGASPALVTVSVTVKGPVTIYGGCVPPLTAEFVDAGGQPLSTPTSAGIRCLAITAIGIPQGQSETFSMQIPAPSGSGSHLIRATVNSRPPTRLPDLNYG